MLPVLLLASAAVPADIAWQPWSPEVFQRARAEHRLVLLDLGAGWCHWCHVMDAVTYRDPKVVKIIGDRFLAVRADADRFPELAQRYEDYGWPATIVFAPDGAELVKLRGYLVPKRMAAMLAAVADDPTPGPSVFADEPFQAVDTHALSEPQRQDLLDRYLAVYDDAHGGWGDVHHYLHTESMEYALEGALAGDAKLTGMARQTLDANLRLIDRKTGGICQYSDASKPDDPWGSPHYEKIMEYQASNLRLYSLASRIFAEPRYRTAADGLHRFLIERLRSPEGAFYTSQDADSRRIDEHRFSRENGWAIAALCAYGSAFEDERAIAEARRAAEWVLKNRRRPDGTFAHGTGDTRPTLGDDVAMVEALLSLYEVTAELRWRVLAEETLAAIDRIYRVESGGYQTSTIDDRARGALAEPYRQLDENLTVARTANRIHRYTGEASHRAIAEHAMRYLSSPSVIAERRFLIGVVLADRELASSPAELTVVGTRADPLARRLFSAARALPALYRRVLWLDPGQPDTKYPRKPAPAAYLCVAGACSRPLQDPAELGPVYAGTLRRH